MQPNVINRFTNKTGKQNHDIVRSPKSRPQHLSLHLVLVVPSPVPAPDTVRPTLRSLKDSHTSPLAVLNPAPTLRLPLDSLPKLTLRECSN